MSKEVIHAPLINRLCSICKKALRSYEEKDSDVSYCDECFLEHDFTHCRICGKMTQRTAMVAIGVYCVCVSCSETITKVMSNKEINGVSQKILKKKQKEEHLKDHHDRIWALANYKFPPGER